MAKKKRDLPRTSAGWDELRLELAAQQFGRCPFCGEVLGSAGEVHHRKLRSRGGDDSRPNLVLVHPACHHAAHAFPRLATRLGWLVPSWQSPEDVPIVEASREHKEVLFR